MKTAISLPDVLFNEAEQFAQVHGLSRSELYAQALKLFLTSRQSEEITKQLDALYAEHSSELGSDLVAAQARTVMKNAW